MTVTREEFEALSQRVQAAEAWICRRPGDAIPQPFIDQIAADAIASVTPAEPEAPAEEVPDGEDDSPAVEGGQ